VNPCLVDTTLYTQIVTIDLVYYFIPLLPFRSNWNYGYVHRCWTPYSFKTIRWHLSYHRFQSSIRHLVLAVYTSVVIYVQFYT